MKKRTAIYLVAALLLILGGTTMAYAESYEGADDWKVSFDGEKMNSNFGNSSLSDDLPQEFQPGDDVTFNVALENKGGEATDWYMTNEVLTTLEESQESASGGNYTYRLVYTDSLGAERVLYDSESVGGEKEGNDQSSEGLKEATDTLKDFLYLDRLESGQRGAVSLYVKVDGETQGNDYQDTLSRLQMNFAAEDAPTAVPQDTTNPSNPTIANEGGNLTNVGEGDEGTANGGNEPLEGSQPGTNAVQTGDERNMLPWALASLASGLVLLGFLVTGNRKKRGEDA